jgi:hypothetical protein
MRSRFIVFILFQFVAWALYFNWEITSETDNSASQKIVQIEDFSPNNVTFRSEDRNLYQLILRDDGIFTRIKSGQIVDNGLWKMDYEVPSIILASPKGEFHYQIIDNSDDRMQIKLINSNEIVNNEVIVPNPDRLFSSSALN